MIAIVFFKKVNMAIVLFVLLLLFSGVAQAKEVTVQTGDTLGQISNITGVPVNMIKQCNYLYSDYITKGQILLNRETLYTSLAAILVLTCKNSGI